MREIEWKIFQFIGISVGTPHETKLGILLGFFYVNHLHVGGFKDVKCADDTKFYNDEAVGFVIPAFLYTQRANTMPLNGAIKRLF